MDLDEFRTGLDALARRARRRAGPRAPGAGLARRPDGPAVEGQAPGLRRRLDALGLARARSAASAGSTLLRGYLGEALTTRDLVEPGIYSMTEVLAPTMIDYARPELAAEMVPRLLRGDETWCQGFSEPDTGSNLGAARLPGHPRRRRLAGHRARRCGPAWPSTPSAACCSPAPAPPSRPTGASPPCSSTWTRPGITVRPIETMHGREEFCEVFFDDVAVPVERTLGDEGQGWAVAMDLLPFERSTSLWHRGAYLHRRLQQLLDAAPPGALGPAAVGEVTLQLLRLPGPVAGHPAPDGRRRAPRPRDLDRQGAAGHHRAGRVRPRRRRAGRRGAARRRRAPASAGAPSTSTPGRRRSTAAAPRSSATSSPAACSTWGPTDDGPARTASCSSGAWRTPPPRTRARRSTPRSTSWAGATPSASTGRPPCRCSSSTRAGPAPPAPPSTR